MDHHTAGELQSTALNGHGTNLVWLRWLDARSHCKVMVSVSEFDVNCAPFHDLSSSPLHLTATEHTALFHRRMHAC
jgi:hypothetical protein